MFYSVLDLKTSRNLPLLLVLFILGTNDWIALFPHVPNEEKRLELLMDFDNLGFKLCVGWYLE